jgi:endogenous inhibitor of DNA gyrase (YacG/DUF329 family)
MRDLFSEYTGYKTCANCEKPLDLKTNHWRKFCSKSCNNKYHSKHRWKFEKFIRNIAKKNGIDRNKMNEEDLKIINRELFNFGLEHIHINDAIGKIAAE